MWGLYTFPSYRRGLPGLSQAGFSSHTFWSVIWLIIFSSALSTQLPAPFRSHPCPFPRLECRLLSSSCPSLWILQPLITFFVFKAHPDCSDLCFPLPGAPVWSEISSLETCILYCVLHIQITFLPMFLRCFIILAICRILRLALPLKGKICYGFPAREKQRGCLEPHPHPFFPLESK